MTFSTPELLILTACVIGFILGYFFFQLTRRKLFNWISAGFWAWVAFGLYFVASPLSTVISGEIQRYDTNLSLSGGADRALWILCVAAMGIMVFFITYLRTPYKAVKFGIQKQPAALTPPGVIMMVLFLAIGIDALVAYRAGLVDVSGQISIVSGRFTGGFTGYQYVAHKLILVPMLMLLLSKSSFFRLGGWVLAVAYFIFSLPNAWCRYITVSLFVAFAIRQAMGTRHNWPKAAYIVAIVLIAAILQIRGHTEWKLGNVFPEMASLIQKIPDQGTKVLGGRADTGMLAFWYLRSYIEDHYTGYDYGIPVINYLLFGWMPYRYFPQKYFLIDWLDARRSVGSADIPEERLPGAKYTLIGSFYGSGGLIGVIIGMACVGFLFRRIDGMVDPSSPLVVRALGIVWMSTMWMDWGSDHFWILTNYGSAAIPAIFMWIFWRKSSRRKRVIPARDSMQPG